MMDEDKRTTLNQIEHRVDYEESKIKLASVYKEDVRFLIEVIKEQEKQIENYDNVVLDKAKVRRYIQLIADIQELLIKYDLNPLVRGPTA